MTVLVVGASGATGRLLVEQLLNMGESVRAIIRVDSCLPEAVKNHKNLSIIRASVLELSDADMARHIEGCNAVASCLGHNMSLQGIYGQPRRLVTDAVSRLCQSIKVNRPQAPVKFVLMNTTGNSNRDIPERVSFAQKCMVCLIRLLLPPHVDNEKAADYLRTEIGQYDSEIEWVVVRPDTLIDEAKISEYQLYPSPTRSPILDPGKTSRINVAHFMAELIVEVERWEKWKGKMPVIYQ